jgi:glycerate 2-kinase
MKIVVAPDSFAGTLSAADAAASIVRGWRSARPADELVPVPMSDGGDGLIDVVEVAVAQATRHRVEVLDAGGRTVTAAWLALPDGRALIESAQACGLARLAASERNPATATSFGVGQLLLAARAAGHDELVVGLGGSATMDGGAGAVVALGHRVERHAGELVRVERGGSLGASIALAADVDSPLLGPDGAARFARQKGAMDEQLPALERDLERFADVVERDLDAGPWRDRPGAGAAGGLGFGLAAFCGARLVPGAPLVAELVELERKLDGASIVVTGEGALDSQTGAGKVPAFVLGIARRRGSRIYAIAGTVEDGAGDPFDAVAALGSEGLRRPAERLAACAAELARSL